MRTFLVACVAAAVFLTGARHAHAQSSVIGANFRASLLNESGFIPPDTMGAVGPNHVMLLINGRYELYSKSPTMSGIDGVPLASQASSLNSFWTSKVGLSIVSNAFDPRVTYDPYSQRWYAVAVDAARSADSSFLFAVSRSSNPIDGWDGFRFAADDAGQRWADFPMLGFDGENVYISANNFVVTAGVTEYPLIAIPKSDLLAPTPTIDNRQRLNLDASTNQTVVAMDNLGPTTGQAYHLWEDSSSTLPINTITGSPGSLNNSTGSVSLPLGSLSSPTNARQPDGSSNLEVDDDRFSARLFRINGSYWGVYPRKQGSDDVLRVFEIDAQTMTAKQDQIIAIPGQDLYYPSIAVNADGDMVIGFTASGPAAGQYPTAYAVTGTTSGAGVTTFGSPFVVRDGLASYQRLASGRNRWGDYSNTALDPADPNIFWTFQEWASGSTTWSAQAAEVIIYQPNEYYWGDASSGQLTAVAGLFSDAGNWASNAVPGASDHVIFSRPDRSSTATLDADVIANRASARQGSVSWILNGHTITLTSANPAAPGLTIGEFQGDVTLAVSGAGQLVTSETAIAGQAGGYGALVVGGAGTEWRNFGDVEVGGIDGAAGGQGRLFVNNQSIARVDGQITIHALGELELGSATLLVDTIDNTAGGELTLFGGVLQAQTINGNAVSIFTTIDPGDGVAAGDSIGQTDINGDYDQLANARLHVDLEGAGVNQADLLNVAGDVNLDGALEIDLLNGYSPHTPGVLTGGVGDVLAVLQASSIAGQFSSISGDDYDDFAETGRKFFVDVNLATVQLAAVQLAAGDVDGDFNVDGDDVAAILAAGKFAIGPSNASWAEGDFDNDGDVDNDDVFLILAGNLFGAGDYLSLAPAAPAAATPMQLSAIPEPASALVFVISLAALSVARRRSTY